MADDRLWKLILAVRDKTRKGQIDWRKTADADSFVSVFSKYVMQLTSSQRAYGDQSDIYFRIINEDGDLVEEAVDTALGKDDGYVVMSELFQAARRHAVGADRALDDLLNQLSDEPP